MTPEVKDLQGKVALVTGAAVVIADIDDEGGRETLRLAENAGGRAAFVHTDVTSWEDLERMVVFAEETLGRLDILHNNAGINAGWPPFPQSPRERWIKTIDVNLTAVIGGTQAAIPVMRRNGGGVIINSASLAGLMAYSADPIYAATKHGVVGLTRALAFLKDESNIRVNCICPGFVDTPLPRRRLASMPAEERGRWEKVLGQIPMMPPSEVAEAVLELVRDESLAGEAIAIQYGQPRRLVAPPMQAV